MEKKKRKKLLVHFIEKAYTDNRVLIACVDRILPALKAVQMLVTPDDSMSDEEAEQIRQEMHTRFAGLKYN